MFDKGFSTIEVTIRNVSQTGARISGPQVGDLPELFELWIPDGFGDDKRRPARRVWRRGDTVGLSFSEGFKV